MLTATTRTSAEQRLRRAWASAYYRKPTNYLRLLLDVLSDIGTERKVYHRQAARALESGSIIQVEHATAAVQGEINRRRLAIQQTRGILPHYHRAA